MLEHGVGAGVDDLEELVPTWPSPCHVVPNPQTLAVIKDIDMSPRLLAFLQAHHQDTEGDILNRRIAGSWFAYVQAY